MSNLTQTQVKHVAKLAKLNLTQTQVKKYKDQLSTILAHIEQLSQVDTANVLPTSQTTGLTNVFRADQIIEKRILPLEDVFLNTKNKDKNQFVVDAVVNKDAN
ncbi:MAG: Asp-tRNA(Asn)/Glu-tRNA(Gln) amidotransferase subunit GatC [Patescibacteria group bacterium]